MNISKRMFLSISTVLFLTTSLLPASAQDIEEVLVTGQRGACPSGMMKIVSSSGSSCVSLFNIFGRGVREYGYTQLDSSGGIGGVFDNSNSSDPNTNPDDDQNGLDDCSSTEKSGGSSAATKTSAGNPINFLTGNKYQVERDFVGGGMLPLEVSRTYNSNSKTTGIFGKSWSSSFDISLRQFPVSDTQKPAVAITMADGKKNYFYFSEDQWFRENGTVAQLVEAIDNYWVYYSRGKTYTFKPDGKISHIMDYYGNSLDFTYTSSSRLTTITRNNSSSLTILYNTAGRVKAVTNPNGGNAVIYLYDSSQRLIKSYYPISSTKEYNYDGFGRLISIKDERGVVFAQWKYNSSSQGIESFHGVHQEKHTFSYGANYSEVTNALGKKTRYNFTEIRGKKLVTSVNGYANGSCAAANQAYTYDESGYLDKSTDWQGDVTDYDYNQYGYLVKKVKAPGTSIEQIETREYWMGYTDKPILISTPLRNKLFEYDAAGRVTKYTSVNKGYSANSVTNKVLSFEYQLFPSGLVQKKIVNGSRTDLTDKKTYEYDVKGNLIKITNALGHVTSYSNYDNAGRVHRITSSNGRILNITYNLRGWVTQKSVTDGATTRTTIFTYDKTGLLTKVAHADGSYYNFEYDSSKRLIKVINPNSKQKKYLYDAASNITKEAVIHMVTSTTVVMIGDWREPDFEVVTTTVEAEIYRNSSQYDALSRLTKIIGGNNQSQQFGYRKDNLLHWQTDGLGKATFYNYDALKRLTSTKDVNGKFTYYYYNDENQLIRVIDPDNRSTFYDRDGYGQVWRLRSPDTGNTTFKYDAAGNVIKQTRADGTITTFTYDALNRMKTNVSGGVMSQALTYDSHRIGHLNKVTNSSGYTEFWHNGFGELSQRKDVINGVDHNTHWYYDNLGRVNQIIYPDSRRVNYTYKNTGEVGTVNTQLGASGALVNIVSNSTYKPFGPIESLTYGNGENRDYGRDLSYRLSGLGSGNYLAKNYTFDANSNITRTDDISSTNQDRTFAYDALQRLSFHSGPDGYSSYTFDNTGNRKTLVHNGSTTTNYYTSGTNKMYRSGSTNYTVDVVGNTKQIGGRAFTYNAENRLSRVANGTATSADYKYNAAGQRVLKEYTNNGKAYFNTKSYYVYGQGGQLLYERNYNSSNAITATKTYVYFNGEVVAYIKNNVVYYVHSDHLGRPEVITNTSRYKVWQARNDAYNRTVTLGHALDFNVGFPGQYWDVDTNLFYNYFRDYDPSIGRYIQSDPIGLLGGLNTYAYVGSNPTGYVDPYGLNNPLVAACGGGPNPVCLAGLGVGLYIGYVAGQELKNVAFSERKRDKKKNKPKPDREQKPDNCPTGTKPIDQSDLSRDEIHKIKHGLRAGAKDWVGISPDGDIITNEDGEALNNGPIAPYLP